MDSAAEYHRLICRASCAAVLGVCAGFSDYFEGVTIVGVFVVFVGFQRGASASYVFCYFMCLVILRF